MGNLESLYFAGGNEKWCSHCGQFLEKLNTEVPSEPGVPCWETASDLSTETQTDRQTDVHLTAALSQLAKEGRNSPAVDNPDSLQQPTTADPMRALRTAGYYSAVERSELLIQGTMWMHLENVILSERRQTSKVAFGMIPFIGNIQNR